MHATAFDFIHSVPAHLAVNTECRLFESMVAAGFPSQAQDYYDGYLNLHQYLVPDPNNVFLSGPVGTQWWVLEFVMETC